MGLLTFKGGIHPDDGKRFSKNREIRAVKPEKHLVYPLSQHIGAPASPIVSVGDRVLRGQKLAEAGGFVSAPVHASVSGTVREIAPHLTAAGTKVESIVVENDGKYEDAPREEKKPLGELSREEILNQIADAGVVGMGGAGFPVRVKLSPKEPEKIDCIIVNGAECEPYITADYRRMLEMPELLVSGMRVVLALFPNAKGVFAVEDNKTDCAKKLAGLVKEEPKMEVKLLQTKYPQGSERQLIYAVTKRAIHSAMLPADAGCIVENVETMIAIHRAVIEGIPSYERVVTVSGDAVNWPGNFLVPCGMDCTELICEAGGLGKPAEKVIAGGPMMGFAMMSTDVPVTKTSSAVLAFTKDEAAKYEPSACINCGRCVEACPSRIVPARLADFAERHDEAAFLKWEGLECVECGACSYVCPAKRHLKQAIGYMRKTALANKKKKEGRAK